jgi:hypothetical protein
VDVAEEAYERYQPPSPSEQVVVMRHQPDVAHHSAFNAQCARQLCMYVYLYTTCNIPVAFLRDQIAYLILQAPSLHETHFFTSFSTAETDRANSTDGLLELQARRHCCTTALPRAFIWHAITRGTDGQRRKQEATVFAACPRAGMKTCRLVKVLANIMATSQTACGTNSS